MDIIPNDTIALTGCDRRSDDIYEKLIKIKITPKENERICQQQKYERENNLKLNRHQPFPENTPVADPNNITTIVNTGRIFGFHSSSTHMPKDQKSVKNGQNLQKHEEVKRFEEKIETNLDSSFYHNYRTIAGSKGRIDLSRNNYRAPSRFSANGGDLCANQNIITETTISTVKTNENNYHECEKMENYREYEVQSEKYI
uniref:Uncharacterized protein n=1 Tax=Romanomermis culicivorax TaxID=13658 RepID=A0A915LAK2_ROMCU